MKEDQDYLQDISEIRSMMERSSKFVTLSGWAGIMAGIYALTGAFIAYRFFDYKPAYITYSSDDAEVLSPGLSKVIFLAIVVLLAALGTAIFFSHKNAQKEGGKLWNPTSKRLLINMAVPLVAGGLMILIFIFKGLIVFIAPLTLIFYGLALYNAGNFTYKVVKILGIVQIVLGLLSLYFIEFGLLFWALGFGFVHIFYGIYIHFKYNK